MQAHQQIQELDIDAVSITAQLHYDVVAEPLLPYIQKNGRRLLIPHRHSFYHIVLFTSATGSHIIDFEHFDMVAGQIYFMIPGQVHSWSFATPPDGYVLNCSEDVFHTLMAGRQYRDEFPFLRGLAAESVVLLDGDALIQAQQCMAEIVAENSHRDQYALAMTGAHLLRLLVAVMRSSNAAGRSHTDGTVGNQFVLYRFRQLIDKHYTTVRLPVHYAAMLHITPNNLNAICTALTGHPAGSLIRERIVLEARRLLINASLSIAAIASLLSFKDNSYFSRFFKKYAGVTPEQFRKTAAGMHN